MSDAISAPVFFDPGFYGWLSINPFFGIKMPALLLFQVFRLFTGLLPGLIRDSTGDLSCSVRFAFPHVLYMVFTAKFMPHQMVAL